MRQPRFSQRAFDRYGKRWMPVEASLLATGCARLTRRLAVLLWVVAGLAFGGCGDTASAGPSEDAGSPFADVSFPDLDVGDVALDAPEPELCDVVDRVTLVRDRSVAGGRQVHLYLYDVDGVALDADFAGCLTVVDERLGELPLVATRATSGAGATLIVAQWTPDQVDETRRMIDAFVAARAPDERVAVWAWSDSLMQVVGATSDRRRITERLDAVWSGDDATPQAADVVAADAAERWEHLSRNALLGARDIVFIAPNLALDAPPSLDRDFVLDWWLIGDATFERSVTASEVAAGELAAALAERDDGGQALLAFCDDGRRLELDFRVGARSVRRVSLGDAAAEHMGADCDLQRIVEAAPLTLPRIDVSFTAEERALFDQLADARDRATVFSGAMLLPGEQNTTPFDASFRGQSSIDCARKSLSFDLDGGDARHLLPHSGGDEFFLISMCLDKHYINQINADRLLAALGTWQLEFGVVELRVDGESRGAYLLVEKVDDELRNDISGLRAVIRRRTDIDGKAPESEWAFDDDDEAAIARYEAFLGRIQEAEGDALMEALESSMDIEQYLRWVALMSLLANGDYVDEVFFAEEETVNTAHQPASFYTIQAWDPDDLFSVCHHDSRFAIDDPHGLLYCAEGLIDHAMFDDAAVYERYVAILESVIYEITVDEFTIVAHQTRDDLLAIFADRDAQQAMGELIAEVPEARETARFNAEIADATAALIAKYVERRALFIEAIAVYRGEQ